MKITLESTTAIINDPTVFGGRVRVWKGHTEDGVEVRAYIAAVSPQTHDPAVEARFASELEELSKASKVEAIDVRFVL